MSKAIGLLKSRSIHLNEIESLKLIQIRIRMWTFVYDKWVSIDSVIDHTINTIDCIVSIRYFLKVHRTNRTNIFAKLMSM